MIWGTETMEHCNPTHFLISACLYWWVPHLYGQALVPKFASLPGLASFLKLKFDCTDIASIIHIFCSQAVITGQYMPVYTRNRPLTGLHDFNPP